MKYFLRLILVLILSLFCGGDALGGGGTSALILEKPLTLQQAALSRGVSGGGGINATGVNPAGLTGIEGHKFSMMYSQGYFLDNFASIVYAYNAPFADIGAALLYHGTDRFGIWTPDYEYINKIGMVDAALILTAASQRFTSDSFPVGINLTALYSSIFEVSATAYLAGAGAQKKLSALGGELCFGLSVQNIGTELVYLEEKSALPAYMQAGAMYGTQIFDTPVFLHTDFKLPFNTDDLFFMGGIKCSAIDELDIIAGGEVIINPHSNIPDYLKLNLGIEVDVEVEDIVYTFGYVLDIVPDTELSHYITLRFGL